VIEKKILAFPARKVEGMISRGTPRGAEDSPCLLEG
jgi:hypothetical protein